MASLKIDYVSARIKKDLDPRNLLKRHGKARADILRRLMGKLEAADSLADIAASTRVRLHWLSGDKVEFMSMDLDHPYRLLATKCNGERGNWSTITHICIHKIYDTH